MSNVRVLLFSEMIDCQTLILSLACFASSRALLAATAGDAPPLPITGRRIIQIATEPELQSAMGNLRHGDTLLLTNGTYNLSAHLTINGRNDVTIRGAFGSTNVILVGKGMNNRDHGGVIHGVWSNGTNTTIAHLTIRETYDNPIIFNSPAQSPRVYCVRLINAGSQFIKSNPADVNAGRGVNDGRVEHCWFEYTGHPPNDHGAGIGYFNGISAPPNDHGAGIGYFNGISAHAADNWIVRGNLFKNLHNPDGSAYPWNPSVLFWRNSSNTVTEQNTFINVDRAVAYGLDNSVPYRDHSGGVIRNNFVYLAPGFLTETRKRGSDGSIIVWNSPGTQVDHNTLLLNQNEFYSIEFRFGTTSSAAARNNLSDAPIHLRDNATAAMSGNLSTATTNLFVNPSAGDLHLLPSAASALNKAGPLNTVTNDFDGELRPASGTQRDLGADELTTTQRPAIIDFDVAGADSFLRFTTVPDLLYAIERTENLNTAWTTIASNLTGAGSIFDFSDPGAIGPSHRFYRVRTQ
jgi:hypothetical protein